MTQLNSNELIEELKRLWVWSEARNQNGLRAAKKLQNESGSRVRLKELEPAYAHSCVCSPKEHIHGCRHTYRSPVCSHRSRKAGTGSCPQHTRPRLVGKRKKRRQSAVGICGKSKHHLMSSTNRAVCMAGVYF